jgi:hypothetical protein
MFWVIQHLLFATFIIMLLAVSDDTLPRSPVERSASKVPSSDTIHAMHSKLPISVRYVKNGKGGQWWPVAQARGQVHLGWRTVPNKLLRKPDFRKLKKLYGSGPGVTQDLNALRDLLDRPSKRLWITFQDGYMWWCTVFDGAIVNPNGESHEEGNFWLVCDRRWSNLSLRGKLLAISDLPGTVTATAGFKGTVCRPRAWETVVRIIRGQKDADAAMASEARLEYERAVRKMVKRLSWKDFEQLIDFVLTRTGWSRISTLGKTREGIDIEAQNLTTDEIAFVQVKSAATQAVLDDYVKRFNKRRDYYARMIFAVHSPRGNLAIPHGTSVVQLWTVDRAAQLVVRLGLGEWIESRFA